jgi:quercetin dioxygenase-like cupin family protein
MSARAVASASRARHYARAQLALQPAVPGARFWAVGLEHTLLTYFEVEADTCFPRHSHPSEQITHVLEGELVFVLDHATVIVAAGEAIAIPADLAHAVRAGTCGARAVDAWSPLPAAYARPKLTNHTEGTDV